VAAPQWETEAHAFLPELDMRAGMPDVAGAQAGGLLPAAAIPPALAAAPEPGRLPITLMADLDDAHSGVIGRPEPTGPDPTPMADDQRPSPASPQPAAAAALAPAPAQSAAVAMPQPPGGDPLAALKVMSAEELIALFS
jgi:hypothetical protein